MTVSRDIRLSVIAEVKEFAKEMATIPKITQKQVAAAARILSGELSKAERKAAGEAVSAAKQAASAWSDSFKAFGASGITADAAVTSLSDKLRSDMIPAAEKVEQQYRAAAEQVRALGAAGDITEDQMNEALGTLEKHEEATREDADASEEAAESSIDFGSALTVVAAAAIAAAAAVAVMVSDTMDLRTELSDVSARSGLAIDTLAGIRLAAEGSGLGLTELNDALASLPKRMADVARGTGEGKVAFDALGISVTDINGNLRDADDVFREFIARLGEVENPAERAALVASAFGESGTKILQALGDPSALVDFIGLATTFGVDTGPGAIQAAEDWARANAELKLTVQGAVADLVDMLSAGEKLEAFTVGLVFTFELLREAQQRLRMEVDLFKATDPIEIFAISLAIAESNQRSMTEAALEGTKQFIEQREAIREATRGVEDLTGASSGASDGMFTLAQKTLETAEAAKVLREEQEQGLDILRQLGDLAQESGADQLTAEEAIQAALEERLVLIRQLEREALGLAATEAETADAILLAETARIEATGQAERELMELRRELAEERNELARDEAEALKEIDDELAESKAANLQTEADAAEALRDKVIGAAFDAAQQIAALGQERLADSQSRALAELDAEIAAAEGNTKLQEELQAKRSALALKQFNQQRLATIAGIGLDTARAAISMILPPPTGFGPILGPPFALLTGGLALGAALSTSPPALHGGGLGSEGVGGGGGSFGPDEIIRRLRRQEGVLTETGVAGVGGAAGLARLNAGMGGPRSLSVSLKLRHKTIDTVNQDLMRMDSDTSRAVRRASQGVPGRGNRILSHVAESI